MIEVQEVDELCSDGELEEDMAGLNGPFIIKIIYPDLTLKQVKSSKLKRLDQIINYNAEMQMLKYRRELRAQNIEYARWSTFWSDHRDKTLKSFKKSKNTSWINFKRHYTNFKEALFGPQWSYLNELLQINETTLDF